MLLYHHCRTLESVVYDIVKPKKIFSDPDLLPAYLWLEKEIGFFPLFLSVGESLRSIYDTGYEHQWRRKVSSYILHYSAQGVAVVHKDEVPRQKLNEVLFSFSDNAHLNGRYMDFREWECTLNTDYKNYQLSEYEKKLLFKFSWNKKKWIEKSKKNSVQFVVRDLDLRNAEKIWVRNQKTKKILEEMHFSNIEIKRIPVNP